jgi:hypothetical protein
LDGDKSEEKIKEKEKEEKGKQEAELRKEGRYALFARNIRSDYL